MPARAAKTAAGRLPGAPVALAVTLALAAPSASSQTGEGSADVGATEQIASVLVELCAMEPSQRQAEQWRLLGAQPEMVEVLGAALEQSSVPMARRLAAWALGESGLEEACATVARAGDDGSDPGFAVALATARARCGEFDDLRALLGPSHAEAVRLRAALTLALLEDDGARDSIFALYEEFAATEQIAYVALALGLYREPSTEAALTLMLRQPEWRVMAAIALGRQGSGAVVLDLRFALESPDPLIRESALRVLVERDWATDQHVEPLLSDRSPRVAAYAASLDVE